MSDTKTEITHIDLENEETKETTRYYFKDEKSRNDIENISQAFGIYGAKNLIPYPYYDTTKTVNGITFTDNGDGTVTVNGTATAQTNFFVCNNKTTFGYTGKVKITGCPSGGSKSTYRLYVNTYTGTGYAEIASDYGDGVEFNIDEDITDTTQGYSIQIRIMSGTSVENLTFKPMLRLASDTDDTWQPYAKTNKQLTDDIKKLEAYEFETLEAAQAAVQAGKVPDGAIIYIPGENGGSSDTYTKAEIDNMLDNKADGLGYDSSTGRLSLKRGTQELGNVTIKSGRKMPSAIAFNQRVDRNWDGLGILLENATDVTADFDSGVLSQKIAANNFDDYDLGMQIIKTININGTNYTAHIIFAHANAFYGGYNNYSVVNTPNIGCIVFVENYATVFGDTTTGYKSSNLRIAVQEIVEALKNAIGINHMIPHSNCLSIKATNGVSNDNRWFENSYGEAMSSDQVIGFLAGNLFDSGESFGRLALFSHIIPFQLTGSTILLRDILPSGAARINSSGMIDSVPSNFGTGVAVFIMLK